MTTLDAQLRKRREARREARQILYHAAQEIVQHKSAQMLWSYSSESNARRKLAGNPASAAAHYVVEALSDFVISGDLHPRYKGMRRDAGSGQYGIDEGRIDVIVDIKPIRGMQQRIEVPVLVKNGYMIQPGLFYHHGTPFVMAQSAFDALVDDALYADDVKVDRPNMYTLPTEGGYTRSLDRKVFV